MVHKSLALILRVSVSFHMKQEEKDVARRSAGLFRSLLSWLIFKLSFAIRQEDTQFHADLMCRLSGWEITRPRNRGSTHCVQMGESPYCCSLAGQTQGAPPVVLSTCLAPISTASKPHFALQHTLGVLIPMTALKGGKYFHSNFTDIKGRYQDIN